MKSQFIGKDPHAGKDWGQEENRVAKDELVGWHCPLNGHEFVQILGVTEQQLYEFAYMILTTHLFVYIVIIY